MDLFFKNNPLPMWIYDIDSLSILAVNNAAVEKYGYSEEEFSRLTLIDIRPEEEIEAFLENVGKEKSQYQWSTGWKHKTKSGSIIDVEILSHEIAYENKNARLVTINDISERKKTEDALKNAEQRYRTTIDNMQEGFQIIGYDWKYLYVNNVAANHGKVNKDELINKTMMEKYPGIEQTDMFSKLSNCINERVPHKIENQFAYPDGTKKWFYLSIEPVPEGVLIISNDITKEKKAEEELMLYKENLEELVKERTAQLEAANHELESFSYSVSHDLRAPIRHVEGFLKLLEKEIKENLTDKAKRYMEIIIKASGKMNKLIEDLLNFSRLGKLNTSPSSVNMKDIVADVIDYFEIELNEKKAEVNIGELHNLKVDPGLMRLVWVNFISNSIKYSSKERPLQINIGSINKGDRIIYYLRDNGIGFDNEYSEKIFGVFQRLHGDGEYAGTGIGLATSKKIIEKHNGKIWGEGKPGIGATFYFTIQE